MKIKRIGFLLLIFSASVFAQSKQELDKVMLSKDAKEISDFIKKYPKNSNTPFLEKKLSNISGKSSISNNTIADAAKKNNVEKSTQGISGKNTTSTIAKNTTSANTNTDIANKNNTDKSETNNAVERDAKTQKKLDVINHLFSNDPNRKEAYVKIKNKSDCNINVKIEGKKTYFLEVPKMAENYIMIPKGTYKVTTLICTAQYASVKNFTDNFEIVLDVAKKAKK